MLRRGEKRIAAQFAATTPQELAPPWPKKLGDQLGESPESLIGRAYRSGMADERSTTRKTLAVLLTMLGTAGAIWVLIELRAVIAWLLIALFLALAINPLVELLQRASGCKRGAAVAVASTGVIGLLAVFIWMLVPLVITQVNELVQQLPHYLDQLSDGRGPLGFLEREYGLASRLRQAIERPERLQVGAGAFLSVTQSIISAVFAFITIVFLTLFMLLEGPVWVERAYSLVPDASRPRWQAIGSDIYRTISGYVRGNLLISLIAMSVSSFVLLILDVPYAIALGLVVGLLDLIPLAGATMAAVFVSTITLLAVGTTPAIVIAAFFALYQIVENHVFQPFIYGKTVQLSPLTVIVAVLAGAELAGILGALGAIPVAGAIQVLIVDYRRERRACKEIS